MVKISDPSDLVKGLSGVTWVVLYWFEVVTLVILSLFWVCGCWFGVSKRMMNVDGDKEQVCGCCWSPVVVWVLIWKGGARGEGRVGEGG